MRLTRPIALGLLFLASCTAFSVRDTAGIHECISAQARAEVAAVRVKGWSRPGTEAYAQAQASYDAASASVLAFLRGILLDAQLQDAVDVSVAKYESSPASTDTRKFLETYGQESGALPAEVVGLLTSAIVATDSLISFIDRLEKNSRDEALDRLERALSVVQPIPFDQVTQDTLTVKYRAVSAPN